MFIYLSFLEITREQVITLSPDVLLDLPLLCTNAKLFFDALKASQNVRRGYIENFLQA